MFGLWRTYRGRRAAAARIIPLIDASRRRLGSIPDSAWRDPYIVGFLAMLITMIATRAAGSLGRDDLAAVQSRAWVDITGMSGDLFGEEICFYDAAHDSRFTFGCRNAELFLHELDIAKRQSEQKLGPGTAGLFPNEGDVGASLWSRYFDAYLGESAAAPQT